MVLADIFHEVLFRIFRILLIRLNVRTIEALLDTSGYVTISFLAHLVSLCIRDCTLGASNYARL